MGAMHTQFWDLMMQGTTAQECFAVIPFPTPFTVLSYIFNDLLACNAINRFTRQLKIKLPVLDKLQNKPLSCGDEDKLQLLNTRIHCAERGK